jgi:hypothetical protein
VAAAAEFDEAIRSSLAALLGTPALTDEAWLQATLPLRPGLGFSLAVEVCEPAYAASWVFFRKTLPAYYPQLAPCLESPDFLASPLGYAAERAQQLHASALLVPARPAGRPPSRSSDLTAKLQHRMAAIRVAERREALLALAAADPSRLARLHSASGKGAAAWLTAIPTSVPLQLAPDLFCIAVCLLLGLPLPVDMPAKCLCGHVVDRLGVHLLTCKHEGGPILRHDKLVELFEQLGHAAGIVVEREVCHRLHTNGRLDFVLSSFAQHGADCGGDVKIVCPTAPTHLRAARTPLGVALEGEGQKEKKYGAACRAVGMEFSPAVFEVYGSQGPVSQQLFERLLDRVSRRPFVSPNWAAASPRAFWRQRFAVLLQRYNGHIIQRLAFACRRKQR